MTENALGVDRTLKRLIKAWLDEIHSFENKLSHFQYFFFFILILKDFLCVWKSLCIISLHQIRSTLSGGAVHCGSLWPLTTSPQLDSSLGRWESLFTLLTDIKGNIFLFDVCVSSLLQYSSCHSHFSQPCFFLWSIFETVAHKSDFDCFYSENWEAVLEFSLTITEFQICWGELFETPKHQDKSCNSASTAATCMFYDLKIFLSSILVWLFTHPSCK